MQHYLDIASCSREEIQHLLHRARTFKQSGDYPAFPKACLANLFYENSTRTRVSFELAAKNLAMKVVNLDLQASSEQKGEVIEDTLLTLAAMGISHFAIRHVQDGLPQALAEKLGDRIHLINAGDGKQAHPSQALLDMMTILEHKADLSGLKVAIVGNLLHSRVANSFQAIAKLLGLGELVLIGPEVWQPKTVIYGQYCSDLQTGLAKADVVMALRVQKERLAAEEALDLETYRQAYAITPASLKWAKPDAIVMHPGPMNRGIEIDSEVADGPQSVILEQVTHGVFARMAILEALMD